MKLAAITHLRMITWLTHEAAATIRERLARSAAEAVGAQDLDRNEAEEAIRAMAFEDES